MPVKKSSSRKKYKELKFKDIDYQISYKPAGIKSSEEVDPCCEIIGQNRAINAIKLGLNVQTKGYTTTNGN